MRPILFLDVDGVLNTSYSKVSLEPELVKRLLEIQEETNCAFVLSSTWRKIEKQADRLADNGIHCIDFTPDVFRLDNNESLWSKRGHEIKQWLDARSNEKFNYCIVDDDADMLDSQLRNFVQTDQDYGLTRIIAYRITRILQKGPRNIT